MAFNLTGKKSSGDAKIPIKKGQAMGLPFLNRSLHPALGKIVANMPKFGTKSYFIDPFGS
jgi:hypothetical protein